jgi:hypothetical protein
VEREARLEVGRRIETMDNCRAVVVDDHCREVDLVHNLPIEVVVVNAVGGDWTPLRAVGRKEDASLG